jgi:hypothetical protein
MKRYVIERDIPKVGSLSRDEYRGLAATSNAALAKLAVPNEIGPMTGYSG